MLVVKWTIRKRSIWRRRYNEKRNNRLTFFNRFACFIEVESSFHAKQIFLFVRKSELVFDMKRAGSWKSNSLLSSRLTSWDLQDFCCCNSIQEKQRRFPLLSYPYYWCISVSLCCCCINILFKSWCSAMVCWVNLCVSCVVFFASLFRWRIFFESRPFHHVDIRFKKRVRMTSILIKRLNTCLIYSHEL